MTRPKQYWTFTPLQQLGEYGLGAGLGGDAARSQAQDENLTALGPELPLAAAMISAVQPTRGNTRGECKASSQVNPHIAELF